MRFPGGTATGCSCRNGDGAGTRVRKRRRFHGMMKRQGPRVRALFRFSRAGCGKASGSSRGSDTGVGDSCGLFGNILEPRGVLKGDTLLGPIANSTQEDVMRNGFALSWSLLLAGCLLLLAPPAARAADAAGAGAAQVIYEPSAQRVGHGHE